jgi:hypothetical protein
MHAHLIVGTCLESRRVRLREFITPLAEFSSRDSPFLRRTLCHRSLLPTAVTRYQVIRTGIVRRVRHSHHPQLALSLTILLQRVPQSLPAAREQPSAGPCTVRRTFGTSSFRGIGCYRLGRSAAHHLSSGHSSEIPPARKRSGLLLTADRYVCKAAQIQGTGCCWSQIDDTRLEVRASIINRDYD